MGRKECIREDAEVVEYDGKLWHRYVRYGSRSEEVYYRHHTQYLHRYVWEKHNGPIPKGYQIHHKDGDPLNNDISNLECLSVAEHRSQHPCTDELRERRRQDIEKIQDKCREWHRSEEGHKWHVAHVGDYLWQKKEFECEWCHKMFESQDMGRNRFCSNACKSSARRASGVDDEDRVCAVCGAAFRINKYSKTICCSKKCAARLRADRKRGGVLDDRGGGA